MFYLIANKIKSSIVFFNDIINFKQEVNKDTVIAYKQYQDELNLFFNEEIKKDVTIKQWCHQCLDLMIIYYFPIFPSTYLKISTNELGKLIINYVKDCQENKLDDTSIIAKIMHYFN